MSVHRQFRRQPVQQGALQLATVTLPSPIRGLVEIENWAYTQPGSAIVLDNWFPTQRGLKLRGGTERWCVLPDPVEVVRSGIEYASGNTHRMFAATDTRLFDVSFPDTTTLVTGIGTITNGNFGFAQLANQGGDWLIALNDAGDYARRYNGTTWEYLNIAYTPPGGFPSKITGGPAGVGNAATGMTYVWKYRNRLFFIEGSTMNAWFLPLNSPGGELQMIPLSGAAKRGGSLLFGASWSIDAGDGIDDKCCFVTDLGEILVFTGSDPTVIANWRQEGRYDISRPLGKNGHTQLGGDVLIATVDGIVPLSAALQKDVAQLSLSAVTRNIERMWMRELVEKNAYPWSIVKWDEGDALFVNFPGGKTPKTQTVAVSNLHTGAWCRYFNYDAMCFMRYRGGLFFGTQDGRIMQCESTGMDNGHWDEELEKFVGDAYPCTMVGGWEMFKVPPHTVVWLQARAAFFSAAREPFEPQLAATTDYEFRIPAPPNAGPDPGLLDLWDQGLWGPTPTSKPPSPEDRDAYAQWDQPSPGPPPVKNTMWVSIGETGFSHAPICQVTVGQQVKPDVELISIAATFVRVGVNV